MPLIESGLVSKVGTSLATGIVKQAGARLAKKLRKTETERALERCGQAAVEALVEEGFPEGTDIPRDHLEGVLGRFAEDEVAHDILARAIREGSLPADEVAQLRECFEEDHPTETLPGFDVERGIAAFVTAFVDRADEEPELQGLIQTKELRAQTRYLRDQLGEVREQTGLLRDIRDRTPDPRERAETARTRYLEELRHRCLMLPVTRLLGDEGLERPLTLDRVYQELDTKTPKHPAGKKAEGRSWGRADLEEEERLSALDAIAGETHLVFLGDAGSGKSTFARAVLAGLTGAALDTRVSPPAGLSRDLVPVFVVLRELSGRLQGLVLDGLSGEKRTGRLAEAVREQALADLSEDLKVGEFAEGLREALGSGECILALDGLDEVPEDLRGRVREAVLAARERFRPAKILVTCRVRSYGGEHALPGFTSHELAPFDEDQIRGFCVAWYRAQGDLGRLEGGKVEEGARHMAAQVLQPTLRDLAGNPLLLTTMAVIHTRKTQLPRGRAQVYEDAIHLLIRDWQQEKVGDGLVESEDLRELLLDDSRLWPLLERLAYEAHRVEGTEREVAAGLPEGDLLALLKREHLGSAILAEEFLGYADHRAGLLVGLGGAPGKPAAFGFVHRTFQEYLAGRYLTRGRNAVEHLFAHAAEGDLWSLAVELGGEALLHVDRNPQALLDVAFGLGKADERDTQQWRRAVLWGAKLAALAGRDAVERDREGPVDGALFLDDLRTRLVDLLGHGLPPVERAEAGRALARLGDPREEVLRVDAMEFCRVPAGTFVMGSAKGDEWAEDDENPQHDLEIPYNYWIGRFPVTQGQYWDFVENGGYRERRFWPEAREHGLWKAGGARRFPSGEYLSEPNRFGDPWDLANHPVVGVTWYEALAFCRWLTKRWRAQEWLPEDWEVRLPSEAEWEKAARGGLEVVASPEIRRVDSGWREAVERQPRLMENPAPVRPYPWRGNVWAGRANTAETGIGASSPVGCFPRGAGPYGCEELLGNVREWTRSLWGDEYEPPAFRYPYDPGEDREALGAPDKIGRVLRGGGFTSIACMARCSKRYRFLPYSPSRDYGLRLLLSPSSSDL